MATYWVRSTGGNDGNTGLSYAQAYATIATAFDNVAQGDTLRLVNDGAHTAPTFADALSVLGLFGGTNYTSDPGLIIEGVDSAGDPALATVTAIDDTNKYFIYNAQSGSDYIWIRGIKFDWSFFGVSAGTLGHIFVALTGMPPNTKWTSCYFYFGDRGVTLTQDVQWSPFAGNTASNNQAVSPGPGTMEVSHCFFENAILIAPSVGGVTADFHHNIIHVSAVNYLSTVRLATGGQFYKDTRDHKLYHNTLVREWQGADALDTIYIVSNSDVSRMSYYNNVMYVNAGETAVGTVAGILRQAASNSDKEAAAQMDYEVFAFGANVNDPIEFAANKGYGQYAFDEAWRAGGSAVVTDTVPTNSVELMSVAATALFNTTAIWTWDGTGSYEMPLPWDYRLVQQRTAGLAGAVPGAVDAIVTVVVPPGPGVDPIAEFVDSAPFFRPILELDARIKYAAKRNRKLKTDLRRYDENVLWEETTQRYFNMATNTTQQITLGGVAEARYLSIETDQDISVSVNSDTHFVPVSDVLAVMNTAVTSLYLKNASVTNTARVIVLAVN